jgi:branched-chain amino acid transport system substrate-binding protein
MHYLKALEKTRSAADGAKMVAEMKAMPTDDPLFGKGEVRQDGRKIHPMYLYQVKTPAESRGAWDYNKLLRTIPAAEAFRPLRDGGCSLVRS